MTLDIVCHRAPDKRGNRDNLGIFLLFFYVNISCGPSLEPSRQDGFNEGSRHMFSFTNEKKNSLNYPCYPLLSGAVMSFFTFLVAVNPVYAEILVNSIDQGQTPEMWRLISVCTTLCNIWMRKLLYS